MKIIAMIPARLGSKRVPKKNLRIIDGQPLISYVIDTVLSCKVFDEVYVNSESEVFRQIAHEKGVMFYKRPEVYSSDLATNDEVKIKTANTNHVVIDSAGNMGLGTTSVNNIGAANRVLEINGGSLSPWIHFTNDTSGVGASDGHIIGTEGSDTYYINRESGTQRFHTNNTERMRIDSSGNFMVGQTTANSDNAGISLRSDGQFFCTRTGLVGTFNRLSSDGDLVQFQQASTVEGAISVSGSTVSYGGFSGLHESSGIANNTAVGTVVSTIDELDTYPTGTSKEGQTRADHPKVEVSDTVGDSAVYGVVTRFDENDKVFVASVGTGSVRVTGACAKGDLLESNGDGTAKVQSDDIVRSKTIGKVTIGNSNTGVKLVSCVLYCG